MFHCYLIKNIINAGTDGGELDADMNRCLGGAKFEHQTDRRQFLEYSGLTIQESPSILKTDCIIFLIFFFAPAISRDHGILHPDSVGGWGSSCGMTMQTDVGAAGPATVVVAFPSLCLGQDRNWICPLLSTGMFLLLTLQGCLQA